MKIDRLKTRLYALKKQYLDGKDQILAPALPDGKLTRLCLDPWCYLETTPTLGLKPCCNIPAISQYDPQGPGIEILRDSEPFKKLRQGLLDGELSDHCANCHIRPMAPLKKLRKAVAKAAGGRPRTEGGRPRTEDGRRTAENGGRTTEGGALTTDNGGEGSCCPPSSVLRSQRSPDDFLLLAQPLKNLRLEITTRCNLRCVYCPASQPSYHSEEMAPERFPDLLSLLENGPKKLQILGNGHGETTFHPQWLELFNPLLELGYQPSIITNLARPLNDAEAVCLSRFIEIQVSMDTVDPDLLHRLRRSVKLPVIISNIEKIRTEAFARWGRPPRFSISCGVYDANYRGLEALADFAVDQGMSSVVFWQLVKYPDIPGATNVYPIDSLDRERIADAAAHLEAAVERLDRAYIVSEIAGGFLKEWRKTAGEAQ